MMCISRCINELLQQFVIVLFIVCISHHVVGEIIHLSISAFSFIIIMSVITATLISVDRCDVSVHVS